MCSLKKKKFANLTFYLRLNAKHYLALRVLAHVNFKFQKLQSFVELVVGYPSLEGPVYRVYVYDGHILLGNRDLNKCLDGFFDRKNHLILKQLFGMLRRMMFASQNLEKKVSSVDLFSSFFYSLIFPITAEVNFQIKKNTIDQNRCV